MAKGWIKLHRQIQHNSLWKEKRKFSKVEAWIDILFMAKYADENERVGYNTVLVPRGSFLTSIRELCDRWGWSNTKVCSFLAHLNLEKMLLEKATLKKTLLTVVNYELYQGEDDGQNDKKTTQKRQNNDAKTLPSIYKEIKEPKNIISEFSSNPILQERIADFKEMRTKMRKPMTDRALQLLLSKLTTLSKNEEEQIAILEASIISSWQSVYALNDKNKPKSKEKPKDWNYGW